MSLTPELVRSSIIGWWTDLCSAQVWFKNRRAKWRRQKRSSSEESENPQKWNKATKTAAEKTEESKSDADSDSWYRNNTVKQKPNPRIIITTTIFLYLAQTAPLGTCTCCKWSRELNLTLVCCHAVAQMYRKKICFPLSLILLFILI